MRALIVNPSTQLCGAEISLLEFLRAVPPDERPFYGVVTPDGAHEFIESTTALGYRLHSGTLWTASPKLGVRRFVRSVHELKRLAISSSAEAVYVNHFDYALPLAGMKAFLPGIRTVLHIREVVSPGKFLQRGGFIHDVVVFNSKFTRDSVCPKSSLVSKCNSRVIYNSVDLCLAQKKAKAKIAEIECVPAKDKNSPAIVVGMFGRLSEQKNFLSVLLALRKSRMLQEAIQAVIIVGRRRCDLEGYGSTLEETVASDPILKAKVCIVDFQSNVWPFYDSCDVVVVPSKNEGFCRTIMEAGALAKPVVAASSGGIVELVEHGVNGLMWNLKDEEKLVANLLSVAGNEKLRTSLGKRLRKDVAERFAPAHNYRELRLALRGCNPC